jgi:hypothetical protein
VLQSGLLALWRRDVLAPLSIKQIDAQRARTGTFLGAFAPDTADG